jgi:putative two-component system response regulator
VSTFDPILTQARILIVDDEPANVALLINALSIAGFTALYSTLDPRQVRELVDTCHPDLILLDLHMPHVDGITLLTQLRSENSNRYLPVVVLTADATPQAKRDALTAGATDFLAKPLDLTEVTLRVRNHLHARHLHRLLDDYNQLLEQRVAERTAELEASQREIVERLALAGEYRDDTTGGHTRRVGRLSSLIATQLGLPQHEIEVIRLATPLHDLGKIGIPDQILLKPGRLTPDEYDQIKAHVSIGASILSGGTSPVLKLAEQVAFTHHEHWDGTSPVLKLAEQVAFTHHEHWDGTSYIGRQGTQIPLASRIVAVADVYDALTNARPYKAAWNQQEAIAEIARLRGSHFDPTIVDAFLIAAADAPELREIPRPLDMSVGLANSPG